MRLYPGNKARPIKSGFNENEIASLSGSPPPRSESCESSKVGRSWMAAKENPKAMNNENNEQ